MSNIGFIGVGNMATALIGGIIDKKIFSARNVIAFDIVPRKIKQLADDLKIIPASSNTHVLEQSKTVLFAVKPQNMDQVLSEIAPKAKPQHLFISICAGTTTRFIESRLQAAQKEINPRVIRVMPNTPALIGLGASALAKGSFATDDDLASARTIFDAVGVTVKVDEDLLDLVTGLTGSGPAYIFLMIESLMNAGTKLGLNPDDCESLVKQMVLGAARMAGERRESPAELRRAVTSPGGTTEAGLKVLQQGGFEQLIFDTVKAATERSKKLGK